MKGERTGETDPEATASQRLAGESAFSSRGSTASPVRIDLGGLYILQVVMRSLSGITLRMSVDEFIDLNAKLIETFA